MSKIDANTRDRYERIKNIEFDLEKQSKTDINKCNLCGNDCFCVITRLDRYGFRNKACICSRCGLVFLNPVMTLDSYREFYKDTYRKLVSAYHGKEISADTLEQEQIDDGLELCEFIAPFVNGRNFKTLLDVGGSIGTLTKIVCEKFKLKGTVLDPAPLEINKAKECDLNTIIGVLEDIDSSEKFDVITMCQTIDHSLDITSDLTKIRRIISSGGLFYISIIDFRAIYLRENSIREAIKPDHPFYLTEDTVQLYLHKVGFEILRSEYDQHRVGYLCKPVDATKDFIKQDKCNVQEMLREIRSIQIKGNHP